MAILAKWREWTGPWTLPQWSPYDVRCVLRLSAFLLAWKLVSLDYSGLADVEPQNGFWPLSHAALDQLAQGLHSQLMVHVTWVRVLQITAAIVLLAGTWLCSRIVTTIGLLAVAAIYLPAVRYALWLYDIELCWTLLMLAVVWPGKWHCVVGPTRDVSPQASSLGIAWMVYFAGAYFLCGWCKVAMSPDWFLNVGLEYIYPAMHVWHECDLSPFWPARVFHEVLLRFPGLGHLMALGTLLAELGWFLALFNARARRFIPLAMFSCHIGIFLASGILFLHLAILQLAVVIRWRSLSGNLRALSREWLSAESPAQRSTAGWRLGVGATCAALVALVPGIMHLNFGLFPDWNQFAWSYRPILTPTTYSSLGYRDQATGELKTLPLHHGGFLDFRGSSGPRYYLTLLLSPSTSSELRELSLKRLQDYATLIRDGHSNGWLLGPLTCPEHLWGPSPSLKRAAFTEIVMLQGEFRYLASTQQNIGDWQYRGELPAAEATTPERLAPLTIAAEKTGTVTR